jgi:hypothetical protein
MNKVQLPHRVFISGLGIYLHFVFATDKGRVGVVHMDVKQGNEEMVKPLIG